MALHLHGLGHFHPPNEISNRFLEELDIGTNDAWIVERTGIRMRRTVLPLDYIRDTRNAVPGAAIEAAELSNAEIGRRAAELALHRAGIDRRDIGLVISGCSSSDTTSPAEACAIANALDIDAPALDVNSACTSWLAGLYLLQSLKADALPDFVLLVAPEAMTRTVDYSRRESAVLWGDAAAAAIVSKHQPGAARVVDSRFDSQPSAREWVVVPRVGHFRQEGRRVQLFAIKKMSESVASMREAFYDTTRNFHFVGHQANLRMLESVARRVGIPEHQHHTNVEWFGNTGAASTPSVLSMNWEKWSIRDDVAVSGVGSGMSWAQHLIRFGVC